MQNRAERGFAQAPHPSSRSLERRTDDDERSAQRNRALNRIRPTTIRNVLPCGERDMTTTATLPDREAEELETRSGPPTKWSFAIYRPLPVGRLMSASTNCEVTVSDVVSMIVIIPPRDSRTTVSTPGRPVCHMEASERRSCSRSNMRNAAVSTIDATFVTSIAMTAAAYGCRSAVAFG